MAKQKAVNAPAEQLALYQRLLASVEGVEDKSNFGSAYTAINGDMHVVRRPWSHPSCVPVLETTMGERHRYRVRDDGAVVGLWRRRG